MTKIFQQIKKVILKIIFLFQVKWHELEVHYNETREAEGENEIERPIISNNDRKRAATRNTTKNTTTTGTTNEYSESDPDDKTTWLSS